jgi:hypothetical protein
MILQPEVRTTGPILEEQNSHKSLQMGFDGPVNVRAGEKECWENTKEELQSLKIFTCLFRYLKVHVSQSLSTNSSGKPHLEHDSMPVAWKC